MYTLLFILLNSYLFSQDKNKVNTSLLWEVSGNGLQKSSYLFGTHHLMSSRLIDTIDVLKQSLLFSDIVITGADIKNIDSAMLLGKMA